MKDAQKPDHVSLTTIVDRLREGQYVIPDFQREFEWKPWDIRELMRSIFLDYYIGSLLLWKGTPANFEALACEPLYGFQGDGDAKYIVLDGQQRLTAMYYAFVAPDVAAPSRQNRFLYFIRVNKFVDEIYEEAFDYDWTFRGVSLLADKTAQFEHHMFPLAVLGQGGFKLAYWVQEYERHWLNKEAEAKNHEDAPRVPHGAATCRERAQVRQTPGGHLTAVPDCVHRARPAHRDRKGLRHLHADQQPRHPARRLRPHQRAAQTQGSPAQALVAQGRTQARLRRH